MLDRRAWLLLGCLVVVFGCGKGSEARLEEASRLARDPGGPVAEARLRELVRDRDPRVRAVAIAGLARAAPGTSDAELVAALKDRDPNVQAVAAREAGEQGIAAAVGILAELARGAASDEVRRHAVLALARLPGAVSDAALAAASDDPNPTIRVEAIRGLSTEGARLAVPGLAARALGDVSWEVRAASVAALARAAVPGAWVPVEAAQADRSEFVRAAAFQAVRELTIRAVPRTEEAAEEEAEAAEEAEKTGPLPGEAVYTPRPDPDAGGSTDGPPGSP